MIITLRGVSTKLYFDKFTMQTYMELTESRLQSWITLFPRPQWFILRSSQKHFIFQGSNISEDKARKSCPVHGSLYGTTETCNYYKVRSGKILELVKDKQDLHENWTELTRENLYWFVFELTPVSWSSG